MNALARAASCSASTSGAPAGSRVKSTSAWRVSPPTRSGRGGPARGVTLRAAARKGKRAPDSNGEDDDDSARAEGLARENAGAPRPRPSSGARKEEKHHHLNKSKSKGSSPVPSSCGESGKEKKSAPGSPKQAMNIPNVDGADASKTRGKSRIEDLALDPNSSIDPDLDIIPLGPPVEDEVFKLRKKRLELVIEEKEWSLEDAREGEDKMAKIVDYVNAVEAYKELCSTQVPNTVSDLLSQYVQVYVIQPGAPGYDQAFEFLCMGDDEDDDEETRFGDGAAEAEGARRGFALGKPKRDSIDISQVDDIIRALVGDDDSDSEDEDEDEEDLEAEAWRLLRSAARDGPGPLHAAQDVEGKWRWLEDDLGRALERKPEGDFVVKLMSVEEMVTNGLNVNSLHEEVDPAELVDFAGCKSWEDAIRVGREVEAALEHMRADGWEVDTRSWCNEADALMVVKELTPLRTMSYVDGRVSSREKEKDGDALSQKEQTPSAEARGGGVMRGDNNVVNNKPSSDSERTPDDETRDLAA